VPLARILFYTATIGALALVGRSLLIGPVPTWITLAVLTVYVTLLLLGVFFLRLQVFVDAVCHGTDDARGVALTFDDGPCPIHTPKVLDMLDRAGVKATFFVIGHKAQAHPDIVRDILKRGHVVGSHSYTHSRAFSLLSKAAVRHDIEHSLVCLETITGSRPALFRPPIGHTNPRIAKVVDELGLTVVGWSVRALDGVASADPERVALRVVPQLEDGAIVLLHDAAERDDRTPASIEALPLILDAMDRKNLPGVTVTELMAPAEE
jgi:peptidoglycan/xylan/chitin deacetylase (PgdA/CDA1 family)